MTLAAVCFAICMVGVSSALIGYLVGHDAGRSVGRMRLLRVEAEREAAVRECAALRGRLADYERWAASLPEPDPADWWKREAE